METKFTPGPWQFHADLPSTEPNWHIVTNASRMRVLANVHIEPGNVTDEANAHLMVASPELFASCAEFLPILERQLANINIGGMAEDSTAFQSAKARVERMAAALSKALGNPSNKPTKSE